MSLIAGVDSSTQSTKVEVRDLESGRVVARSSAPHPPTTPPVSEQDPADWWSAFEHAWAGAGAPTVAAISVAGQQHGMVVLDADRRVVRPAKLWNDTESAADAGWLCSQLEGGAAAWAAAVGSVPVASFTITKLSWLHRKEPEAWNRLAHVVLPHDWLTFRLLGEQTGALVTDRGDASGTGYWSPATGDYRFDLLGVVDRDRDWTSVVPRVLAPTEVAGEWRGAAVAAGTGDNMAAALGLALGVGDTVVSIGTSGTVFGVSDRPSADASGAVAGFADATGRYLPLVCTLNAAKVLDAVRGLLGVDHVEFDRLAMSGERRITHAAAVLRRRTDAQPARRHRPPRRIAHRRDPRATRPGRSRRRGVRPARRRRRARRPLRRGSHRADRRWRSVGGDASGVRRAVRPAGVRDHGRRSGRRRGMRASGGDASGEPHASIAARWGLGRSEPVEPDVFADPVGVRARYAELRGELSPAKA